MSFQALARKWRPRRFDQLVGQEHVVRALTHALDSDQLHHALLFSGTRGVGKTTLARIIAKCLNCEYGVSATPCTGEDACSTCREIDEGRYVDLIEVDAASRTGVDDTRELMDNVQYAPTRGRTKVYLIDEVHMLTKHSFNALLKTLEEPPPRVQFLLATTEPEKIPVTILSRCLQFPLKRLTAPRIATRLRYIVDAESLSADDQALQELARSADGSMRDGLSLLDQAIAFGGGHLDIDGVREMLGTIGEARVAELVEAIIEARPTDALIALEALYTQGIDMDYLLEALATAWQHIATVQVVGEAVDEDSARWQETAGRVAPRLVQVFYDITLTGRRDLAHAPDPLVGTRMTILRMLAFTPEPEAADKDSTAAEDQVPAPSAEQSQPGSDPARSAREAMAQARAQLQGVAGTGSGAESNSSSSTARQETQQRAAAEPDRGKKNAETALKPAASADTSTQSPKPASSMEAAEPEAPPLAEMPPWLVEDEPTLPETEAPPGPEVEPVTEPEQAGTSTASASAPETPSAASEGAATAGASKTPEWGWADQAASPADSADSTEPNNHNEAWHELLPELALRGLAAQLASHATCRQLTPAMVELAVTQTNIFLVTADAQRQLQQALAQVWDMTELPPLAIHTVDHPGDSPARRREANAEQRQQDAVASMKNDPIIEQLRSQLGARLRVDTIKPHRSPGATDNRDPS